MGAVAGAPSVHLCSTGIHPLSSGTRGVGKGGEDEKRFRVNVIFSSTILSK